MIWNTVRATSYKGPRHPCWFILVMPSAQRSWRGYTSFTLSVCPSVSPSVDRMVSALYLPQYLLDPFHFYTSYQATSEGVPCIKFFQFMGQRGYPQYAGVLVLLVENVNLIQGSSNEKSSIQYSQWRYVDRNICWRCVIAYTLMNRHWIPKICIC